MIAVLYQYYYNKAVILDTFEEEEKALECLNEKIESCPASDKRHMVWMQTI